MSIQTLKDITAGTAGGICQARFLAASTPLTPNNEWQL